MLEVDDPRLGIVFHLAPRLVPVTAASPVMPIPPASDDPMTSSPSPSSSSSPPHVVFPPNPPSPLEVQRSMAQESLDRARQDGAGEGFVLKNLEKDCEWC